MYNAHRGMVPAPNSRLTELLDQLRQEFENQSRSTGEFEHQCTSASISSLSPAFNWGPAWERGAEALTSLLPRHAMACEGTTIGVLHMANASTVTGQLQEMEMIRQKVYQLEQAQIKMKQE